MARDDREMERAATEEEGGMTELNDLMQELACAVRQKNCERAEEVLSVIAVRCGYERAISRGRYQAVPHKPTELSVPNVITIHDLPSREGIVIETLGVVPTWRAAA